MNPTPAVAPSRGVELIAFFYEVADAAAIILDVQRFEAMPRPIAKKVKYHLRLSGEVHRLQLFSSGSSGA